MTEMTPQQAVDSYRFMVLMRRCEETVGQLYALGVIAAEPKLSIGREALVAGLIGASQYHDCIISGRRCHGFLLALGVELDQLLSALVHQPQHQTHPWIGIDWAPATWPAQFRCQGDDPDAILGAAISLALIKRGQSQSSVVFAVLGDEAVSHPRFADRMRAARRWRLPIVWVVDHATPDGALGALGYDSGQTLNGTDFRPVNGIDDCAVEQAGLDARARAQSGAGPQGLIISTQAFRGHASTPASGPGSASKPAQPANDPVLLARARAEQSSPTPSGYVDAIDHEVRALVRAAGQRARQTGKMPGSAKDWA